MCLGQTMLELFSIVGLIHDDKKGCSDFVQSIDGKLSQHHYNGPIN